MQNKCRTWLRCVRRVSWVVAMPLHEAPYQDILCSSCGLQESVVMVRDLFRDAETTEFVIATIPTVLGINESGRLLRALRHDEIPCKRIIVNQASFMRGLLDTVLRCLINATHSCRSVGTWPSHCNVP